MSGLAAQLGEDAPVQRDAVKRRLRLAISNLIVEDWRLLTVQAQERDNPVSERSVAFALGWHLRALMERRWDIDCEYNRADSGLAARVKRHPNQPAAPLGTPVTPDLIVHRRGDTGTENNLLVLELKTNEERQTAGLGERGNRGGSLDSVTRTLLAHEYKHGVLLDLGVTPERVAPTWTWVDEHGTANKTAECVYGSSPPLEALITRGREEEQRRYAPLAP